MRGDNAKHRYGENGQKWRKETIMLHSLDSCASSCVFSCLMAFQLLPQQLPSSSVTSGWKGKARHKLNRNNQVFNIIFFGNTLPELEITCSPPTISKSEKQNAVESNYFKVLEILKSLWDFLYSNWTNTKAKRKHKFSKIMTRIFLSISTNNLWRSTIF